MNTQQYDKLKTCLAIIGLSVAVNVIIQMFATLLLVLIGEGLANIVAKGYNLAEGQEGNGFVVKFLEFYRLLVELLVATGMLAGMRCYYQAQQKKGYLGMLKAQKWDSPTSLYLGFVILAFAGILALCKGHLLSSELPSGPGSRVKPIFSGEPLYWAKIRWIVVVPLHTEIFYRGFIFRQCRQNGFSALSTILLSAVSFSLMYTPFFIEYGPFYIGNLLLLGQPHIWQWYTYKFVLGYTLATVYARTQSIELTIMLSSLHNFFMCFFDLSGFSNGLMGWHVFLLLVILGLQYFICYEMHFVRRILFGHKAKPEASTIVH